MEFIIYFAIAVIVIVFLWWLLQQIPLPGPANQIITIVIVAVIVVLAIGFLLSFSGGGFHLPHIGR